MRKTKHIITILILLIILLSFSYKVIASPTLNEETIALEGQTLTDVNDLYNKIKDYKDNTNLSEGFRSQLSTDFMTLSNAKTLKAINKTTFDNITTRVRTAGEELDKINKGISSGGNNSNTSASSASSNNINSNGNTQFNQGTQNQQSTTSNVTFDNTWYTPKTLKQVPGNIYKAEAGHDENGGYHGGTAGDQKGDEVSISPFGGAGRLYTVFRYPDEKIARTMAFLAGDIANNELVGYDQNQRGTLFTELQKMGYDPSLIQQACECDCSSLISAVIFIAFKLGNVTGKNVSTWMDTGTLFTELPKLGFSKVMGPLNQDSIKSSGQLQMGDILVKSGSHTLICIGEYYTSNKNAPGSAGVLGQGLSGGYTAVGEEIDDRQNLDDKNFRFQGFPGEVTYEGEVSIIRNFFAKIGDFIDYLLGLIFLIIKIVIIGFVNIAYNIFLSIVSFMKK